MLLHKFRLYDRILSEGGVMLVSAISVNNNKQGYNMSGNDNSFNSPFKNYISDTAFNSLTPYSNKKTVSSEKLPKIFDEINEWQDFCHKQMLGQKLNVIA